MLKWCAMIHSFEKVATTYTQYACLQERIAEYLLKMLECHCPSLKCVSVLDLGCGSGFVCKHFLWEYERFCGVDLSPSLLALHPRNGKTSLVCGDFEDVGIYRERFSLITASSSLQWAGDLKATLEIVARHCEWVAMSIFTHLSLKEIYELLSVDSPLMVGREIQCLIREHFSGAFELKNYAISFASRKDALQYLKKTGILGNKRRLSYAESKRLYQNMPYETLSFEVLFFVGKSLESRK